MRLSGFTDTVRDLTMRDHLCWVYERRGDLPPRLVEYVGDGIARGQRVRYVGNGDRDALRADLTGLPELDRFLDDGAVEVMTLAEMYPSAPVVPAEQVARFAAATNAALGEGYRGLRVVADCTTLVTGGSRHDAFARYEYLLDCYTAVHPLTVMCTYDRASLGGGATAELAALHPLAQLEATPLRVFADPSADLALAGEVDALSVELLQHTLDRTAATRDGRPLRVNAAGLTFIDHQGLRTLDAWAGRADTQLVLVSAGRLIRRLAELVGLRHVEVTVE